MLFAQHEQIRICRMHVIKLSCSLTVSHKLKRFMFDVTHVTCGVSFKVTCAVKKKPVTLHTSVPDAAGSHSEADRLRGFGFGRRLLFC